MLGLGLQLEEVNIRSLAGLRPHQSPTRGESFSLGLIETVCCDSETSAHEGHVAAAGKLLAAKMEGALGSGFKTR